MGCGLAWPVIENRIRDLNGGCGLQASPKAVQSGGIILGADPTPAKPGIALALWVSMRNTLKDGRFQRFLPWGLLAVAALGLSAIFALTIVSNVQRQKQNSLRLLLEKGAALIRSFEAGTRAGMHGLRRQEFKLQRLLSETALQPDIVYLIVTAADGRVLAHSEVAEIGSRHGADLDLRALPGPENLNWRRITGSDGAEVFEVYRPFVPSLPPLGRHGMHRLRPYDPADPVTPPDDESLEATRVIFVGLDLGPVAAVERAEVRNAVVTGAGLLLAGVGGIVLVFLGLRYSQARTSLSRIQAFSDKLVASMPLGLLAIDVRETVTSFNPVAAGLLRLPADELADRPVAAVLPAAVLAVVDRLRGEGGVVETEVSLSQQNGPTRFLAVTATALKDETGRRTGSLLLFKDLTDLRVLGQEIERHRRLAAVGRLAAGVAHEIRNPLSSIKGFATYFRDRYAGVPEDDKIARIMIQEVERLNRVVSRLLDFARPVRVSTKPVDLRAFLEDSLKLVERQAQAGGIALRLDCPPTVATVHLDPDRISQVLLNLYLNAVDAMVGGGQLTVTAGLAEGRRPLRISVADTGDGIKPSHLGQVFDPFFTTKGSGTGLGLAVAHNIIEAHGGEIRVDSHTGRGTCISLFLPQERALHDEKNPG
jgi:two-component system, NtrC family, sensor histidine kinase HydH